MDLMYVGDQSIMTDLKIMLKTVKILFMPESTEGFDVEIDAAGEAPEERVSDTGKANAGEKVTTLE